ncbi:MAG: S8 family serine peptidase, partial [Salinibacter sp.]|uniref:S8 family serine peptidase n=1 Tax=Salinibacter sp. TaxID=2065818 RepID=UPI002FC37084
MSALTAVLTVFVFASLFAGAALGQGADPPSTPIQEEGEGTWHDNVLRIKVSQDVADQATPVKQNGTALLGVASVDQLNQEYNAVSIEPVFDVGGEYEERQRDHGLHRWYEIRYEEGAVATDASVEAASAEYGALAEVEVAEGDARAQYHVTENPRPPVRALLDPLPSTPDDPLFDDQYGFENIEAEGGWQTRTGDTTVVVSVHDSGITGNFDGEETTVDHPDLEPNVWYGGDPDDGSVHGKSFTGDPADLTDNNGHGTHVTGTMAAVTNNGFGVAGTAGGNGEFADGRGDGIRYMVLPELNEPDAYIYAADNGAVISQNSWGFISPGVFPQATEDAIDYFIENGGGDHLDGGLVVFSAGNDGADIQAYPAFYPPTVAVASTNENDDVSGFSNFGDWVDIGAPGTSILSTWLTGQGSVEDNFEFLSGTSMAAPHVSGAAALVVSEFSGITDPDQVESTLEQAADDINASVDIGAGRLNLAQALQEDDGEAPAAITDLSVTDVAAAHVDLQWTVPEGSPAVYDIRYSTDPIENDSDFENAQQVEDPPSPSAPGETDSALVDGLTPDTEYFFAIKSSDTFGNTSDLSNVPSATTDNAPAIALDPEEQSQTLAVGETGTNSFSILNAGKDTLEYTLEPVLGGTEISDPIGEPTTPASEADFTEGNYETAIGSAPEDGEPVPNTAPVQTLDADLEGSFYVGVNFGDATSFVSFEGETPEILNILSSYPGSGFSNAGDFPRDDDSFVYELDNEGELREVDVESGEFTNLGNVGQGDWTGMSTDPTSGTIYVNTGATLYTLDPDAPSVEEVGSFGVDFMIDIAVDGQGQMYGYSLTTDAFYEIDKETGEATQVGSIGFDANFGQGLTWDTQNQVMLMAAFNSSAFQPELRTVNRETGSTELIGILGEDQPSGTDQLGWVATPISATGEWLAAEPTEGEVPEGEPDEITLSYQTTFEEEGVLDLTGGLDYMADVEIQSNDPGTPTEQLPVTLTVNGTPAISVSEDPLDFGDVFAGTSTTDTLTVFNDSDDNILQV